MGEARRRSLEICGLRLVLGRVGGQRCGEGFELLGLRFFDPGELGVDTVLHFQLEISCSCCVGLAAMRNVSSVLGLTAGGSAPLGCSEDC